MCSSGMCMARANEMHILCHMIFNPMKCEYCLCGIWITANGIWIQPEYCYIYSFFITSNITSLYIPRAHGSAARVSRPLSPLPPPPSEKRSGPQTTSAIRRHPVALLPVRLRPSTDCPRSFSLCHRQRGRLSPFS